MRIGTHVSIAGNIWHSPGNAAAVGAEVFQIFSRSPHGGPVKPITSQVAARFKAEMNRHKLSTFYIHTPYFINLASIKNNIYYGSISVLRQELERGNLLGCSAVMTHLGSFGELSDAQGFKRVVDALIKVLDGYRGKTQLLLEMSAGAGRIIGDTFSEIAKIIFDKKLKKLDLGVCFDTCHAFASGYDLRNKGSVEKTLKDFDKTIGLEKLKLVHVNDSKGDLGKHLDRHEHIGKGKIGIGGFAALASNKILSQLDWILETPKDNPKDDQKNIATLQALRYT
ncbi:MAG: hypothetical protein A3B10_03530 [Candidatus Doudnabacteria bacterium RIFCSPLOWO2_01_FULL_44_21]|uniref:Probable endonuclease 4 n=1 Tax=Candidatus Doudnabacteria bacterium RIFCSPLOWO2_01_FULL_44_21 TaxID=1817841 RepID=A0A1F5PYA3_9BACT|nr:MAG: hypothetical protein A3B10_03530 [Candidatus Doudnabacteria bacterium RIFCSPLOWO2_01_FULL_44_21]